MREVTDVAAMPAPEEPELEQREALGEQPGGWARLGAVPSIAWVSLTLLASLVLFSVLDFGAFATTQNLSNIALDASILLVISVGMTYVIITGGIDLSVGSVLVFSTVVASRAMGGIHAGGTLRSLVGLAVCVACGSGWGIVNGVLISRLKVAALVVTLGTLGMSYGAALMIAGGTDVASVPGSLANGFGIEKLLGIPYLVWTAAAVALIAGIVLAATRFGRYTYAVGSNAEAARRAGIGVERQLVKVYVLQGALVGLAGFLSLARFGTTSIAGHNLDNLAAITAVIIGGTSLFGGIGTVAGTVIGVLIPAVLQNGFVIVGLTPYWQQIGVGAVLILAVYLDRARRGRT